MTVTKKERDGPELELGESADERAELVRSTSGEKGAAGVAAAGVGEGGIGEWGEEADEQVEDVDGEAVGDDVEALQEVDPEGVDGRHRAQGQPPGEDVRRVLVEDPLLTAGGGGDPGRDRRRRFGDAGGGGVHRRRRLGFAPADAGLSSLFGGRWGGRTCISGEEDWYYTVYVRVFLTMYTVIWRVEPCLTPVQTRFFYSQIARLNSVSRSELKVNLK